MFHKLYKAFENLCFIVVLGSVGTAILSYCIRRYFQEFFDRLSPQGNALFIFGLWIVVTVLFAGPLSERWNDED